MAAYIAAFFSAVFAAGATLLVKCFVKRTDSTVVTTIQSIVMLAASALICLFTGSFGAAAQTAPRSMLFMVISGIATGLTWLTYYHALREGDADKVMPIEKANIFITILIAVFFFHEMRHFSIKMIGAAVVFSGLVFLMAGSVKSAKAEPEKGTGWLVFASLSSAFAAVNTISSKLALAGMDSNFGTFLNTAVALIVVLLFLRAEKKLPMLLAAPKEELMAVALSGISTAFCWICYYYAVKYGPMTAVAPLNKLSVPMVILFSHFVLGTKTRKDQTVGLTGIVIGMMVVAVVS